MGSNRFDIKVKSELKSLAALGDFITETLSKFGSDQNPIYQVNLAVDEACTNIIKHAYSGGKGDISLILEFLNDDLIVTITDKGKPFDPNSIPTPDLSSGLDKRKEGGLGIYFMHKLMDEVSYSFNHKGNRLTMRKRLSRRLAEI